MVQFEMNPEIHDLLFAKDICEGMIVRGEYASLADDQTKYINWCTVTNLVRDVNRISFIGVYEDGTKATRDSNSLFGWYVVKESIPEIEPVTGLKIVDLPNPEAITTDDFAAGEGYGVRDMQWGKTPKFNLKPLAQNEAGDPPWAQAAEDKWWDEKGTSTRPVVDKIQEQFEIVETSDEASVLRLGRVYRSDAAYEPEQHEDAVNIQSFAGTQQIRPSHVSPERCLNPNHYDPETGHNLELHNAGMVDWDIDANRPYSEKVAEETAPATDDNP